MSFRYTYFDNAVFMSCLFCEYLPYTQLFVFDFSTAWGSSSLLIKGVGYYPK